ncbi:MAG: DNA polymerase I [Candidatus Saccharibacteria bacterium]|nr:DNA polymerase I [Candidatus Saccharibacteria bacterium]
MRQRLVVIDGKSIFYRGYYAMPNLTTSKGMPSGGVYGFASLSLNIIKKLNPDYVCVAWDKSQTNIRSRRKLYAQYKAQRVQPPQPFLDQIPSLFDLLKAFNWPVYEFDDYEADDIMATLAHQASQRGLETVLVSSDFDLLQALDEHVKIYVLKRGLSQITEFNQQEFKNKYNIEASQFRDLKALMGDSSDNVPGVKGVGVKGATVLIREYKTLENIYKSLDKIDPKVSQKLKDSQDMAFLSQKLVTLMLDAPVKLNLKSMSIANLDTLKVQQSLRKLEFFSLLSQIPKPMQMKDQADFLMQGHFTLKKLKVISHTSLEDIKKLDWSKPVLLHAYCQGRFGRNLKCLLASDDVKQLHLYPTDKLVSLSELGAVRIYGYDTKQLVQVLTDLGLKDIEINHDLKTGAFLLNSGLRQQTLTTLASEQLGYVNELDELSLEDFKLQAGEIGAILIELKQLQVKALDKETKLKEVATEIDWPFIPVLAHMEREGMALDKQTLIKLKSDFQEKIDDLKTTIYDLAGVEFNLSSPSQMSKVLYEKLQIPTVGIKKNKNNYSTDAESLQKLKNKYPIVGYILSWRELAKLQSTYVVGLLEHLAEDGRVYSDVRMTGTSTGRLSSANPNLQNIPIKTDVGSQVRQAFIAPKGYQLISADYSQFELRLVAVLAGDQAMIDAFNQNQDIHRLTASLVFDIPLKKVSRQQRYLAKTINFGILYGQGPHSLANLTGMSFNQAKDFIAKYFENRPKLLEYQESLRIMAKNKGYVETLFGRRRAFPEMENASFYSREAIFRQAINMPIQGTEADLMKLAMIQLSKTLDSDCRQIMQIHDSILIESPKAKVGTTSQILKQTMENIYPSLGINLEVIISVADHWPV